MLPHFDIELKEYIHSDSFELIYEKSDVFDYNKINHLIPNIDYRNTLGNNSNMSFSNVTQCGGDFSGCCVIQTDFCNNTSDYFDYCDTNNGIGTSTGFIYKNNDSYYNVCHKEKIQDKVNMFSN